MPVRLRKREDHRYIAELKAMGKQRVETGDDPTWCTQEEWDATPIAEPGDTWRVRWYARDDAGNVLEPGPIAGYDICCIKCRKIHGWTTATNCSSRRPLPEWEYTDPETGAKSMKPGGFTCDHSGKSSCWTWTGSLEEGTLDAKPSLWCQVELGGCGYHGWLTNGVLSDG